MSMQTQATPLESLPANPQQQQQDETFVNNILEQMEDGNNAEAEYSESQQRYQDKQFGVNHQEIDQNIEQQRYEQEMQQQQQQMMQQQMMQQQMMQQAPPEKEKTFSQKLLEQLKQPLMFLVLYVFFSIPQVRKMIMNQLGRFTSSDSLLLWGTTLLAGVFGSVLFYVINRFL